MSLFNHAFVINLQRRTDRWNHATKQLDACGIQAQRFEGYDAREFPPHESLQGLFYEDKPNGNAGCTASHRALLTLIAHGPWDRVLVLEDDFLPLHTDTRERLAALDPPPFDLLYLGGHYMEAPISRISSGFIRCAGMLTTSSYVITREHARRMVPYLTGIGPIDNLFSMFARKYQHVILQPRLFAQYTSQSDLCGETRNNVPCMTDQRHENMV